MQLVEQATGKAVVRRGPPESPAQPAAAKSGFICGGSSGSLGTR